MAIGLFALAIAVSAASGVLAVRNGWAATGDNALMGIRTRDILHGHFPLIGQPTTGDNLSDAAPSSHPGPMEFYLLAPFTLAFGAQAGLPLGAAAINATALVAIIWAALRRGGLVLAGLVAAAVFLASASIGAEQLHDPLSSAIGVWPALAMVLLGWGVLDDDRRLLVPFIIAASFTMQAHLSYLSFGAPFVIVVLGIAITRVVREIRANRVKLWKVPGWMWRFERSMVFAVVMGVVLWMPPFVEQFTRSDGNISAIIKTFTAKGKGAPSRGIGFGLDRLFFALAPPPIFMRRLQALGHLASIGWLTRVLGVAVLVVLGFLLRRSRKRSRQTTTSLALLLALTMVAGVVSAGALPGLATLKVANFRWMWVAAVLVWTTGIWMAYRLFGKRLAGHRGAVRGVVGALALMAGIYTVASFDFSSERDVGAMRGVPVLSKDVRRDLPKGRYKIGFDGGNAGLTVGPAVAYDLYLHGYTIVVNASGISRAYGDLHTDNGDPVKGTLTVHSAAKEVDKEDDVVIARATLDDNGVPYEIWVTVA